MRRRLAALLAVLAPASAGAAESKLPQMDFANPLTVSQVVWMAIIMGILYVLLRNWLLPQIGGVMADRAERIRADLDAARTARRNADDAVTALDRAIAEARAESERTVNAAIENARARARADALLASARLDAELARAEAQIADARGQAMASLVPIAEQVATGLLERLTGHAPDRAVLERALADSRPI